MIWVEGRVQSKLEEKEENKLEIIAEKVTFLSSHTKEDEEADE